MKRIILVLLFGLQLSGQEFVNGSRTFGARLDFSGDISPAQITVDQNDYNPTNLAIAAVLRLSSDASRNITGVAGGADGRILVIHNVGAQNIVLVDDSASSTAANRIALSGNLTLAGDDSIILQYDSISSRWRNIGGAPGAGGGGSAFSAITGSTNTTAAMVVGTGASLAVSGSGTIAATTAAALAANGGNCSAGQFAQGVDAAGVAEGCAALPSGSAATGQITLWNGASSVTGSTKFLYDDTTGALIANRSNSAAAGGRLWVRNEAALAAGAEATVLACPEVATTGCLSLQGQYVDADGAGAAYWNRVRYGNAGGVDWLSHKSGRTVIGSGVAASSAYTGSHLFRMSSGDMAVNLMMTAAQSNDPWFITNSSGTKLVKSSSAGVLNFAAGNSAGDGVTVNGTQTLTLKTLTTPVIGSYTVAGLPAAGTADRVAIVTDAATAGSCTSGGGANRSWCRDTGAAWEPLGDGGAGGSGDNISVNGTAATDADFDNATPAAPANGFNVRFQKDAGTPNNISAHLLTTDLGTTTFGAGAGIVWTFDAGASDPVVTFGSGTINVSAGALQVGGAAVALQSITLTAGAGLSGGGDLSANRSFATASGEADFLASGALTCGASTQGKIQVHTTPIQYCDNAATPVLQYAAYGDSAGAALAGDSATSFFGAGALEKVRQHAATVYNDAGNVWSTGTQDFSAASMLLPISAGAGPTANGAVAYDSTANQLEYGDNTVNRIVVNTDEAQTLSSKTLTDPTISVTGWTNANHAHAAANSGGTLDGAAIAAGTVVDARIDAALMRDSELAAFTVTKTNMTLDAEGTGNNVITVAYKEFVVVCQGAAPSTGFSLPASNAATATCEANASAGDVTATTAVSITAYMSFAENGTSATSQSVQGRFQLPDDLTGNIGVDVTGRTSATSGDVLYRIQTVCIADGEVANGTWNAAQSFTADTAKGTTLQWNSVAHLSSLTITGCTAGEHLLFRFWRDATQGGDTLTGTAEMASLRFKLRTQ